MIAHRIWRVTREKRTSHFSIPIRVFTAVQEGWFLFGIIPLYTRTREITFHDN